VPLVNALRALLLVLASLPVCGPAVAGDTLQQVLDKVASVYGPAPGAIRETGTTFSTLEGEGSMLRLTKFPDKFHVEIAYAVASEDRTMIGDRAWNKRVPASRMSRGAIALQAARIALPWSLLSRQAALTDKGEAAAPDGRTVRGVAVALDDAMRMQVDVDPQTGYILRTRSIFVMGDTAVEFATVFSDFRREGGRIHAAREEQFAAGSKTGYSFIEKVEYLETLPDSAFAPWALAASGQPAVD